MGAIDSWWIAIGIFGGMFFGMIFIAVGFIAGYKDDRSDKGHNQRELQDSDSADDLLHKRSGSRGSNNRCHSPHTLEEKVMVLNTFRTGATWFEKCVLDEISDDLIELDARRFVEHPFYEYELDDETDSEPCPMGFCPHAE